MVDCFGHRNVCLRDSGDCAASHIFHRSGDRIRLAWWRFVPSVILVVINEV